MSKKRIVVLSGAGISAESGIATFRDANGLWENHRVEDVASIEGWYRNPKLVLDFYNDRHRDAFSVKPNAGHLELVNWEKDFEVFVITQNVDALHEMAGSRNVLHLHGELSKYCSERNKNQTYTWPEGKDLTLGELAPDGSQVRPFIVWFGEDVPNLQRAAEIAGTADAFVVVGTSLQVYPAAGLVGYVPKNCRVFIVDPKKPSNSYLPDNVTYIQSNATQGLPTLSSILRKEIL